MAKVQVYHGTSFKFPIKELTAGPDPSANFGRPWPGLWLTKAPEMAAAYASWSADCHRNKFMRVIALEMSEDCPHVVSPEREIDILIRNPEPEFANGNLRVVRGYRVRRKITMEDPHFWDLIINWDIANKYLVVPNSATAASMPYGTFDIL